MKPEMKLKIDKGIPIPPVRQKANGLTEALRQMRVGESVMLERDRNLINGCAQAAFGVGKYTVRKEAAGFRLWRIK